MAAGTGVALTLGGANLQLACIQLPLRCQDDEQDVSDEGCNAPLLMPPPLPPSFARLRATLAAVRALSTPALPFAAHVLGCDQLRVVTQKAHVAAVFKLLRAQQAALGVEVKDVKSHVTLGALPAAELEQACACGLLAALLPRGWWQQDEARLLGASLLEPAAEGRATVCPSLALAVQLSQPGNKLMLLVKPEQVEFRHPACARPGACLADRSARLAGSQCRLLPDFREGLIEGLRPADESVLARLRPLWAGYGVQLPAGAADAAAGACLVEVRLSDDPDAPTFLYPPCCVLGPSGLLTVADKRTAPAVQAALGRLMADLATTPVKFLGAGLKVIAAHVWYPEGLPAPALHARQLPTAAAAGAGAAPAQQLTFVTARQHEQQGNGGQGDAHQLALGEALDVAAFAAAAAAVAASTAGGGGAATGPASVLAASAQQQRQRRPHYVVPVKLQVAMDEAKRLQAEAAKPAGGGARPTSAAAAAASAAKPAPTPALRQAAAAAAAGSSLKPAVPVFKRAASAAAAAAAVPKARAKQAAAGQKRAAAAAAAAGKLPAAAKRPKVLPASAAGTPRVGAAAGTMPSPGLAGAATTPAGAPPSATTPGIVGKGRAKAAGLPADIVAGGGGGGCGGGGATEAALPPKAPAKPRAKPADIDVAAVAAKVVAHAAAGALGKLTVPELKAYLKSVKQPVGGKKGDLEERVRQSLGGAGGGPGGNGGSSSAAGSVAGGACSSAAAGGVSAEP